MPLYECSQCHVVENTALTNFWSTYIHEKPPLCSECDPEIGKWHGVFPKVGIEDYVKRFPDSPIEYRLDEEGKLAREVRRTG